MSNQRLKACRKDNKMWKPISIAIGGGASGLTILPSVTCKLNQTHKGKTVKLSKRNTNLGGGFGAKKDDQSKEQLWKCVEGCGACCKLAKGPTFATHLEIFDDPNDIQLYESLIGEDGWCIHYDKSTRTCSIYDDRPYFCRVEPDIFEKLYGIPKKKFNKEACSCCKDTIKAIYGANSEELDRFNKAIRS